VLLILNYVFIEVSEQVYYCPSFVNAFYLTFSKIFRISCKKSKNARCLFHNNVNYTILGQGGLIKQLTGKILQRALEAEVENRLGYEKHGNSGDNSGDSRNGYSEKTVLAENQELTIAVPHDRNGSSGPRIIEKHQKRVSLFNGQILSMFSFGMIGCDIKAHLEKLYNAEVSPDLISRVTGAVMEEVSD
jgi:transposase-like protein